MTTSKKSGRSSSRAARSTSSTPRSRKSAASDDRSVSPDHDRAVARDACDHDLKRSVRTPRGSVRSMPRPRSPRASETLDHSPPMWTESLVKVPALAISRAMASSSTAPAAPASPRIEDRFDPSIGSNLTSEWLLLNSEKLATQTEKCLLVHAQLKHLLKDPHNCDRCSGGDSSPSMLKTDSTRLSLQTTAAKAAKLLAASTATATASLLKRRSELQSEVCSAIGTADSLQRKLMEVRVSSLRFQDATRQAFQVEMARLSAEAASREADIADCVSALRRCELPDSQISTADGGCSWGVEDATISHANGDKCSDDLTPTLGADFIDEVLPQALAASRGESQSGDPQLGTLIDEMQENKSQVRQDALAASVRAQMRLQAQAQLKVQERLHALHAKVQAAQQRMAQSSSPKGCDSVVSRELDVGARQDAGETATMDLGVTTSSCATQFDQDNAYQLSPESAQAYEHIADALAREEGAPADLTSTTSTLLDQPLAAPRKADRGVQACSFTPRQATMPQSVRQQSVEMPVMVHPPWRPAGSRQRQQSPAAHGTASARLVQVLQTRPQVGRSPSPTVSTTAFSAVQTEMVPSACSYVAAPLTPGGVVPAGPVSGRWMNVNGLMPNSLVTAPPAQLAVQQYYHVSPPGSRTSSPSRPLVTTTWPVSTGSSSPTAALAPAPNHACSRSASVERHVAPPTSACQVSVHRRRTGSRSPPRQVSAPGLVVAPSSVVGFAVPLVVARAVLPTVRLRSRSQDHVAPARHGAHSATPKAQIAALGPAVVVGSRALAARTADLAAVASASAAATSTGRALSPASAREQMRRLEQVRCQAQAEFWAL